MDKEKTSEFIERIEYEWEFNKRVIASKVPDIINLLRKLEQLEDKLKTAEELLDYYGLDVKYQQAL